MWNLQKAFSLRTIKVCRFEIIDGIKYVYCIKHAYKFLLREQVGFAAVLWRLRRCCCFCSGYEILCVVSSVHPHVIFHLFMFIHVLHCLLVAFIQCSRVMLSAFYPFLHKSRWLCSTLSVIKAVSLELWCIPSPYGYKYLIILIHIVSSNTWNLFSSSTDNSFLFGCWSLVTSNLILRFSAPSFSYRTSNECILLVATNICFFISFVFKIDFLSSGNIEKILCLYVYVEILFPKN